MLFIGLHLTRQSAGQPAALLRINRHAKKKKKDLAMWPRLSQLHSRVKPNFPKWFKALQVSSDAFFRYL